VTNTTAVWLIKACEQFTARATWDVNAYRLGYGSDTYGAEQTKVHRGMTTTVEAAEANLEARLPQFERICTHELAPGVWSALPGLEQAVLLSICYNYGRLPGRIVGAINDGHDLPAAIRDLKGANHGVNAWRRELEADVLEGKAEVKQDGVWKDGKRIK